MRHVEQTSADRFGMTAVMRREIDDAAIIVLSRQSPEAFGQLYDRYARQLYRYAYRRVGPDLAEDVVADTFLAAFKRRDAYDLSRPDARPWLFGIVTKEIARRHRAEKARYRALARAGVPGQFEGFADQVTAAVTAQSSRSALADALRRLSGGDRDVLLLIAWGGLSYQEVAETLGIKVGTVRSRLHRARQQVRAALGDRDPIDISEVKK